MATATMPQSARPTAPGRYDNFFFPGMALLILATVLVGFARTYFLAGVFHAPLPNVLIHIHAVVFSTWILLFITQVSLVSAGRVDIHRKLGLFGFGLASLMVVIGVLAANNSLARGFSPSPVFDASTFYVVPISDMFLFATLIFFAYRTRSNPGTHKHLILLATIALMDAPTGRVPFAVITHHRFLDSIFCWAFLLLLIGYDLWSRRKLHPATIWGGLLMVVVELVRIPIGMTASWHAFAAWVQGLGGMVH